MATLSTPQEVVEAALAAATGDGTVVIVTDRSEANLRWANSSLTTNGEMTSRSVTVITVVGRSTGTAVGVVDRSVARVEDLRGVVEASEVAARSAQPAGDAAPLVSLLDAGSGSAYDDAPEPTSIGVFEATARDLGRAFVEGRTADRLHFGFAEQIVDSVYLGTSGGVRLRHVQPTGRVEMNAKSQDLTRSAYVGHTVRHPSEADVLGTDRVLATRLGWASRRLDLGPGRYEVILPPTTLADLFFYYLYTSAAKEADEGRSVFSASSGGSRVGERLATLPLTIGSDPAEPGLQTAGFTIARESSPLSSVFDNGFPVGRTDWLSGGVLAALPSTRAYAATTETPTAPAPDNLFLRGDPVTSTASIEDMVRSTGHGLLLSTFWYVRMVDPQTLLMTGLTRDGVYQVDDGEVVGAVTNFRFNESPVSLLRRITEVGRTERCYPREWGDWFTRTAMPPARVPDFNMSSVSQAQ